MSNYPLHNGHQGAAAAAAAAAVAAAAEEEEYEDATASLLRPHRAAAAARLHAFAGTAPSSSSSSSSVPNPNSAAMQLAALQQAQYERRTAAQLSQQREHHHATALANLRMRHQQQHQQHQQQVAAPPEPAVAVEADSSYNIPIGFFRDPRGNSWAASLQHPLSRTVVSVSASASASDNSPDPPKKIPPVTDPKVITLSSDEEDDPGDRPGVGRGNGRGRGDNSPPIPSFVRSPTKTKRAANANPAATVPPKPSPPAQSSVEPPPAKKLKRSLLPNEAIHQPPSKAKNANAVVPAPVARPAAPVGPPVPAATPTASTKQPPTEDAKDPMALKPKKALAGHFTQKLLSTQQSEVDKHNGVQDFVNKLLLTATGWTKETAPARIPFPPQQLTIDMDQVEELAHEMVADRFQAVGDAMRVSYSELKSRHDEILLDMQEQVQECGTSAEELDALVQQHRRELDRMQAQHASQLAAVAERLEQAEREAATLRAQFEAEKANQKRAFRAFLRASAHSLRCLNKD